MRKTGEKHCARRKRESANHVEERFKGEEGRKRKGLRNSHWMGGEGNEGHATNFKTGNRGNHSGLELGRSFLLTLAERDTLPSLLLFGNWGVLSLFQITGEL